MGETFVGYVVVTLGENGQVNNVFHPPGALFSKNDAVEFAQQKAVEGSVLVAKVMAVL